MKTPQAYLEHVNLSVSDIDNTIQFIKTALPEFEVRGEGIYKGKRWVHIGTVSSYLAINEWAVVSETGQKLNHIGFVVDNIDEVAARLLEAGYKRSFPRTKHPFRLRDYFEDGGHTEYEFVQYLSEDPVERNDYSDLIKETA